MPTTENAGDGADTSDTLDDIRAHTYEATLFGPLFYASEEGSVIRTDPTIAATALAHAIGYDYYGLTKRYLLVGEETVDPSYDHLRELPFVVSEMVPARDDIEADERTFRTVSYGTERTVVSSDNSVGEFLTGAKSPVPRGIEGSNAGWHKVREYVGLSPDTDETNATGSGARSGESTAVDTETAANAAETGDDAPTFTFTIWTPPEASPPPTLGFRVGIKRTGEIRAERTDTPADAVSLNQFLLQSVYDVESDRISELLRRSESYERGTDVRTCRFHGVDREWVENAVIAEVLDD